MLPLADVAEQVLRALPLAVLVFDRRLRVLYRNRAADQLFGPVNGAADLAAAGTGQQPHLDWETELHRVLDTAAASRHDSVVLTGEGGKGRLLEAVATPLARADLPADAVILTVEDVTTRAGLERRLAVSERLAAVGKLAARVAHELNNPLDGILRYINLAIRVLGPDQGKVTGYLEESRKGLMRMAQIIGELLQFSRSSSTAFDETDINGTVEEAIRAMQQKADQAGVTVTALFREQRMPSLRGSMLFQVCCNLIKNAIDAMADGGRLTITSAVTARDVVIRFEDTGVGLPDDVQAIFEPFYTTKEPGEGTGLGLAICKDYIERLRGRITAESRTPSGAAFTLYIPLASCVPDSRRRTTP